MASPMNENNLAMVAERFRILGDPSRLRLLQALSEGESTVADLTERCATSQANVSKHLSILLRGGFVARRKEGLHVFYRIADASVFRLCDLVCGSIQDRLARDLARFAPPRERRQRRARG
ncbi:MAG: metalloregulator ArsR/SmtB family transcription factor [bacterium]